MTKLKLTTAEAWPVVKAILESEKEAITLVRLGERTGIHSVYLNNVLAGAQTPSAGFLVVREGNKVRLSTQEEKEAKFNAAGLSLAEERRPWPRVSTRVTTPRKRRGEGKAKKQRRQTFDLAKLAQAVEQLGTGKKHKHKPGPAPREFNWTEVDPLLGKVSDKALARSYTLPAARVRLRRLELGIPAFNEKQEEDWR